MTTKRQSDLAREELKPFLNSYTQSLLNGLIDDGIIQKIKNPKGTEETAYELVSSVKKEIITDEVPQQISYELINSFINFKQVALSVYHNLQFNQEENSNNILFGTIIRKYERLGLFKIMDKNDILLVDIFDKADKFLEDKEFEAEAIRKFTEHKLNFSFYINRILVFYARSKASKIFTSFDFDSQNDPPENLKIDFIGKAEIDFDPDIIFGVNYRKKILNTLRESLVQGNDLLYRYNKYNNNRNYLIIVTFTEEKSSDFDKVHYRFKQNLEDKISDSNRNIFFAPVSIYNLHFIDREFELIKNRILSLKNEASGSEIKIIGKFEQRSFKIKFRNQIPPKGYPNNNDHFYHEIFELPEKIEINLNPIRTAFWRFGFRFSDKTEFPGVEQHRHSNEAYADVHIFVGNGNENPSTKKFSWKDSNILDIWQYHIDSVQGNFKGYHDYNGETVKLVLSLIGNTSALYSLTIFINDVSIGTRDYNLSKFKYFKLAAWCDQKDFELDAEVILNK